MTLPFEHEEVLAIGQRLGRYTLVEEIRCDDYVREYTAKDENLQRLVTINVIRHSQDYSKEFSDQFLSEGRALAQLNHPNILKVFDYGQDRGYLYLVTEYIQGTPLEKILGKPMEWQKAIDIILPVIETLDYAHEKDIIHRDLTPANILLTQENNLPIISNFRLSQIIEEEETRDLTTTNVGLGSPFYMSPEQGKGATVDYRADIYAAGAIFYELVTGKKLFDAQNGMEVVIKQVTSKPIHPRKFIPDLPESIENVILKALDKDPDNRFQSMREFADALRDARENKKSAHFGSITPKRIWIPILSLSAIVLVALILLSLIQPGQFAGLFSNQTTQTEIIPAKTYSVTDLPSKDSPKTESAPTTSTVAEESSTAPVSPIASSIEPITFPAYPITNSALDAPKRVLSPKNISQLTELARLGYPKITSIAWSESYQTIVGGTSAGVYYYAGQTASPERFFEPHGWITTLALSSDEKWLATGDKNGDIRVWEFRTGKEIALLHGHTAQITCLSFSHDSKYLASSSDDKTAREWDIASGAELYVFDKHNLEVTSVRYSQDDKQIYTASKDFKVIIWDAKSGEIIQVLTGSARINDMDLSSDGKWLATGLQNSSVEIWDTTTGKKISTLRDSSQVTPIRSVVFTPKGRMIVTSAEDGLIRFWSVGKGDLMNTYSLSEYNSGTTSKENLIIDLIFSQNGTRLFGLTDDESLLVYTEETHQLEIAQSLPWKDIGKIAISPENDVLLFEAGKDSVFQYSLSSGKVTNKYSAKIPNGNIFFKDGSYFFLAVGSDLYTYNLRSDQPLTQFVAIPQDGYLKLIQDDTILAVSLTRGIQLWSVSNGFGIEASINRFNDYCQSIFQENESYMASGSVNGVFTNENVYQALCKIPANPRRNDETISADEKTFAFGLDNGKVELWTIGNEAQSSLISASKSEVNAVALSPDGKLLATGGADNLIQIWDTSNLELLMTLDHQHDKINDLEFSQAGNLLVSSSSDGSVIIWGIP